MVLTKKMSNEIVSVSHKYLGNDFCWETFNCVHFVREVYSKVGIEFPLLIRNTFPPMEFHLTNTDFDEMPIGHSVFFKRKNSVIANRSWTHVAIIVGKDSLIHCTRNLGNGVVITSRSEFLKVYNLAPTSSG